MGGAVQPRRATRWSHRWPVVVAPLVLLACSDGGESASPATDTPVTASTDGEALVPVTTEEGGTRPVPTVPPSTVEGQSGSEPGVVEASPTIAPVPVDAVAEATEAFVTSTAGGVMPVTTIDGRQLGDGTPGPTTTRLRDAYWAAHDDPRWTTAVDYR